MKVLIVDDEVRFSALIGRVLDRAGFDTITSVSVMTALELVSSERPAVMIVDYMLGEQVDGLTLIEAARQTQPTIGAILITGYPSDDLRGRMENVSRAELLEKPFESDALIAALQRLSIAAA